MSAEAMAEALAPDLSQGSADLPADFGLDYIDAQSGQRIGDAEMQAANQLAGERFSRPLNLDSSLATDITPSNQVANPLYTTEQSLLADQAAARDYAAQAKPVSTPSATFDQQVVTPEKQGLLSFKNPDGSLNWKKAGFAGVLGAGALMMSPEIPEELDMLTDGDPERLAMFNRQLTNTDWDRVRADAAAENMSLAAYTSRYFDKVQSTKYQDVPPPRRTYETGPDSSIRMPGIFDQGDSLYRDPYANSGGSGIRARNGGRIYMNRGGPLQQASRYVKGGGTGRSDSIPAYLSDGEYVIDAETVALLGDGSNKAGADVLDKMRNNIRSHKGKALAKGKFSPDSKSPLTYLKGVA